MKVEKIKLERRFEPVGVKVVFESIEELIAVRDALLTSYAGDLTENLINILNDEIKKES